MRLAAATPLLALTLGAAVAGALGLPAAVGCLVSLFLFSCVLVGLAQQTLP